MIQIFRDCHLIIENNFALPSRSIRHAPLNLARTLKVLSELLKAEDVFSHKPGRDCSHDVLDCLNRGWHLILHDIRGQEDSEMDVEFGLTDVAVELTDEL